MPADRWTTQTVLGLAPDAASVAAARKLARTATWSEVGCTDTLVFGRCQGSGKTPYQVTVDLTEPAFRCTCPSRKLPCKHGLALLLLWAEHGDAVGEVTQAADFASDWKAGRDDRAAGRAARAAKRAEGPVDPEARAKRQAQREEAMTAGLDDLERWMGDLVRNGLAGARHQPYAFWDAMAARLVDAQIPGLADRVREVGGAVVVGEDWADVLLAEMGRWQLAVHAWRRRTSLPEATLADLRVVLGWPWRTDEVDGFPTVEDRWVVAGVAQGDDGRITSQRTWLWGERSGRWAVVLDFAAAGAALAVPQVVGSVVADAVRVHPGSDPARVAFSDAKQVVGGGVVPPATGVDAALDAVASALAANPWRDLVPVVLADVVPAADGDRWWLVDPTGARLPLDPAVEPWPLLARSVGHPVTVCAEWRSGALTPLAIHASPVHLGAADGPRCTNLAPEDGA